MTKVNGISLSLVAAATFLNVANADSTDLGEVSVTATKTERKVADVPASIEVITEEDIKKTSANTVNELLQNISGVNVSSNSSIISNSGAGTNKVLMRGFGGYSSGRVLVMVDGVAMNDAQSQNVEWNKIAIGDVERIEVVKGANSALYGSSAMGGVINIITKKPKEQKTDVSLTYGSMNTKMGSISTTGKVDKLGYYLSGTRTISDGYVKEVPASVNDKTLKTGIERDNLVAKVTYDISDNSDVYLNVSHFKNQTTGTKDIPNYNPFYQDDTSIKAGYNKYFNNGSDISVNLYATKENKGYNYSYGTSIDYESDTNVDRLGGNLKYTLSIGNHVITTGLDIRYDELDSKQPYTSGKLITKQGKQDYSAIFIQDEIFIGNKAVINIGGRYDRYDNHDGSQYQSDRVPTTTNYTSKTFSAFSPKVGAVYNFSEDLSVRASIGKAFRVPTLNDLYSTAYFSTIWYGNPNLDPEKVLSYEVGFDYKLYDKAKFSLTAYQSDAEDFIYNATRPDGDKEKVNVGEVEIQGIETELFLPISDTLDFMANYTYNKSTITKFKTDTTLEGNSLILVPKHKASASVTYTNPQILNITANVRYVADRYSDDANTESKAYKGYTLYDLKLSRKITENSEFIFNIEDLFDKGYTEYYVSPGRVVMATLKMSF